MKRSVVPAQITTVEDRIFGGLSPQQLVLMLAPFCIGFLLYAVALPNFQLVFYKIAIVVSLETVGAVLSIRVKDRILLLWIITVARYNARPRYYLYNKQDAYLRDIEEPEEKAAKQEKPAAKQQLSVPDVPLADAVRIREAMSDPRAKLRFTTGKDGKLRVSIHEIK